MPKANNYPMANLMKSSSGVSSPGPSIFCWTHHDESLVLRPWFSVQWSKLIGWLVLKLNVQCYFKNLKIVIISVFSEYTYEQENLSLVSLVAVRTRN